MIRIILATLLLALAAPVSADNDEQARTKIAERFPGAEAGDVVATPVPGLYEVTIGPVVLYVSKDGRYLLRGNLFDMKTDENLTESREARARAKALAELDDDDLITYSPDNPRHTITVFTDTSCSYCREFHRQIQDYMDLGIKVRYAFYPRNGMGAASWSVMQKVSCADDRKAALTAAKQGMKVDAQACRENHVMEQWQLGRMLGIRGTPAIMLESGQMIPGYLPPQKLLQALEQRRQAGRK
ncbi:MAG: DsbC family protein [Gammaproteobacteria bacterium]|nr:DsbC family protein [Gammaproteobacteria bacterium]